MNSKGGTSRRSFLSSGIILLGITPVLAAEQSNVAPGKIQTPSTKPWFDARLRAFFKAKQQQARAFAKEQQEVAPEVWNYFEAGVKGDWAEAERLWRNLRDRSHHYEG